ncbi:MAG: polysaccharide pyruvyl transferase family protein, partial [Rothia mucilaginosa]|nr:polysaccharide pyruvyl transferase family protein [Rothia mucilaginosa]
YGLGEFTLPLGMLAGGVPELMVAAALRHAAVASDARRTELLEVLRAERAYLLTQILASGAEKLDEVEAPAPFPTVEQVPALPEPLGATVRAARELFTETSLTAGFEWAMSDRAHSWDAEHRRQLECARAIGGYSAHGAEQTRPVTVEAYSEAPAEAHPAQPGLLARVARRLRG